MSERPPQTPPSGHEDWPFTNFVRALRLTDGELNRQTEEMMEQLRRILVTEMRRRSLWTSPPSYVGVYGHESWASPPNDPTLGPLEELLNECYAALFGRKQIVRLEMHLKVKANIEGLVRLYLKNFLSKRQKDHDPLGYRLFEIVCLAVREAVQGERLHVLQGPRDIRNDTILGISPKLRAQPEGSAQELDTIVARWNDELMPGLVTAERRERRQVTDRLGDHIFGLRAEGIEVFRFKNLIDTIKRDVRFRMADAYERDFGTRVPDADLGGELVRVFLPEYRVESFGSFHELVACVANSILRLDRQRRTRQHLERLWNYLRRFALDSEVSKLPSFRHLEKTLKISRNVIPGMLETLGSLAQQCQARSSERFTSRRPPSGGSWDG